MPREHRYRTRVRWTGNVGSGTASYRGYRRSHEIAVDGKPTIAGSSDPAFAGDAARWNPEELFVASLSTCHMLWYLHLCADAGIRVVAYADEPEGVMVEDGTSGAFVRVVLRPRVTLAPGSEIPPARELHDEAHHRCFIANSVKIPVTVEPEIDAPAIGDAAAR